MNYTLEPGRCIVRDGKPLCTLHGVADYEPAELDDFATEVVSLLNTAQLFVELRPSLELANKRLEKIQVFIAAYDKFANHPAHMDIEMAEYDELMELADLDHKMREARAAI